MPVFYGVCVKGESRCYKMNFCVGRQTGNVYVQWRGMNFIVIFGFMTCLELLGRNLRGFERAVLKRVETEIFGVRSG